MDNFQLIDVMFRENNILYNVLCFLITENEKLFDKSGAKLYWRTILHIFGLLHHAYIGFNAQALEHKLKHSDDADIFALYTFRIAYLTGWNVMFQSIFLCLALVHDILEWCDKHSTAIAAKVKYCRDVLFCAMVLPYTCFVFSMFWGLYAIDRELVFPKVYDAVIPWWFNQCVHTNIMVGVVLEVLLQSRIAPTNKKLELIMNAFVGVLYAVVYYTIYFLTNRWLYNVFGVMTWWQVCIFQICIWLSSYIFYTIQFPIGKLIHGAKGESLGVKEGVEKTDPYKIDEWNLNYSNVNESSNL